MALTQRTRPYETLIRHHEDGAIGADHRTITEVVSDGLVISAAINPPQAVAGPELGALLGQELASALAYIAQLEQQVIALMSLQPDFSAPPAPAAQRAVSRAQALIALHRAGLLEAVEAYFSEADAEARIAWAQATEFRGDSPTLAGAAAGLGLSAEALDNLFREAASVTV